MSSVRTDWQKFKKNHPEFEKHKAFKSNVGPQLDKFVKSANEANKLRILLLAQAEETAEIMENAVSAMKGYEVAVKHLEERDKTIRKDYTEFLRELERIGKHFEDLTVNGASTRWA